MITFEKVAITFIFGMMAFLLFAIYSDATAEKFTLNKEDWTCTETESRTFMMMVGKVMIPQTRNVCVQYGRT